MGKEGRPKRDYEQAQADRQAGASAWMRALIDARTNCREALNRCTMDPNVSRGQVVYAPEPQKALHGWILDYHRQMKVYKHHPNIKPVWNYEDDFKPAGEVTIPQPEGSGTVHRVNYFDDARDEVGHLPTTDETKNVDKETVGLCDLDKWRSREVKWTERVYAAREHMSEPRRLTFREPIYLPVEICTRLLEQLNDCVDELGFAAQIAEIVVEDHEPDEIRNEVPEDFEAA